MQFPRWLSWLVVLFLTYILYVGNKPRDPETPPPPAAVVAQDTATPHDYKHLRALLDGDRWQKGLNPDYQNPADACTPPKPAEHQVASLAVILQDGDGAPAHCGDTVALVVDRVGRDGVVAPGKAVDYVLGQQPAFDALVVGMLPGEQRLLMFTPATPIKTLPFAKANTVQILQVTWPVAAKD